MLILQIRYVQIILQKKLMRIPSTYVYNFCCWPHEWASFETGIFFCNKIEITRQFKFYTINNFRNFIYLFTYNLWAPLDDYYRGKQSNTILALKRPTNFSRYKKELI